MAKRKPLDGAAPRSLDDWDQYWDAQTKPDGFINWKDGHVTVMPVKAGDFPQSLERMRIEVSTQWRALGYSPSIHWVQRWILADLHHAQDFLDGKMTYARNPWEDIPHDETPWSCAP